MTALSADLIHVRLGSKGRDRLVVAPLLDPARQLRSGQASVDLRLGSRFQIAETTTEGIIDTVQEPNRPVRKSQIYVPLGHGIVLHPHQLVLGETFEFVRLPEDLMAYVVGRSSWGRDGLIVATAVGVHPGFAGPITLELRNLGEVAMRLYPTDPIAQLFVHKVDPSAGDHPPGVSQFSGASGPAPGVHRDPLTLDKIKKLGNKAAQ